MNKGYMVPEDQDRVIQALIKQLLSKRFIGEQREAPVRKFLRQRLKHFKRNGKNIVARVLAMISEIPPDETSNFISSCLKHYQNIYYRSLTKEPLAPGLELLETDIRKELTLVLNRSRGKGYEVGLGNWVVQDALRKNYPDQTFDCEIDRRVFQIEDTQGQVIARRADIFVPDLMVIVEIKSGRMCLNKHIRSQIAKDKYLLQRNIVKEVYWILFGGASASVLDHLDAANINFLDFSYE